MEIETFKITNDKAADWAISQIAEAEAERDRLIDLAQQQISDLNLKIEQLQEKCKNDTAFLKGCLFEYFSSVPHKITKTQESYQLLAGKLVFKKPSYKINHDDQKLIDKLEGTEYVEIKKSLKWGEFKKNLAVEGNDVIDIDTGEIIDGCSIEEVPGDFNIKIL